MIHALYKIGLLFVFFYADESNNLQESSADEEQVCICITLYTYNVYHISKDNLYTTYD